MNRHSRRKRPELYRIREKLCNSALDKSPQRRIIEPINSKRDDRASPAKPAFKRGGGGSSPQPTPHGSHSGAVRDERNGSSPLQDGMRCRSSGGAADQGGTAERTFAPDRDVRGVFLSRAAARTHKNFDP